MIDTSAISNAAAKVREIQESIEVLNEEAKELEGADTHEETLVTWRPTANGPTVRANVDVGQALSVTTSLRRIAMANLEVAESKLREIVSG